MMYSLGTFFLPPCRLVYRLDDFSSPSNDMSRWRGVRSVASAADSWSGVGGFLEVLCSPGEMMKFGFSQNPTSPFSNPPLFFPRRQRKGGGETFYSFERFMFFRMLIDDLPTLLFSKISFFF